MAQPNETKTAQEPVARIKKKLLKPHTHEGEHYDQKAVAEGVEISVTHNQEAFLKSRGVIG